MRSTSTAECGMLYDSLAEDWIPRHHYELWYVFENNTSQSWTRQALPA